MMMDTKTPATGPDNEVTFTIRPARSFAADALTIDSLSLPTTCPV